MPVRWGLLHPENSNHALIATEIGVWETSNLLSDNVIGLHHQVDWQMLELICLA